MPERAKPCRRWCRTTSGCVRPLPPVQGHHWQSWPSLWKRKQRNHCPRSSFQKGKEGRHSHSGLGLRRDVQRQRLLPVVAEN